MPETLRHLIGGKWVESGETFESRNPHDGSLVAVVPTADASTVDRAVSAARDAFATSSWTKAKASERAGALLAIAAALEAHREEIARLATVEMGKPIVISRDDEVDTAVDRLRYFAGAARAVRGSVTGSSPDYLLDMLVPKPIGVSALLIPWNDPVELAIRKMGAALAAGCTVVLKSAELAPASLTRFVELCVEADVLPPGVVNLVHGPAEPTGKSLVSHAGIDHVSFTGSTRAGTEILTAAAPTMKRVTLECGGKAPAIIFPDCDLEKAIDAVAYGAFLYTGQSCSAVTRVVIHNSVHDAFVDGIVDKVKKIPVGDPLEEQTRIGPLVSAAHADRVMQVIEQAKADGGSVVLGGDRDGAYVRPTIITNVRPGTQLEQQEVFGPVLAIVPFETDEEAIAIANGVEYGLQAAVWTRDIDKATSTAAALEVGDVWLNTYYVRQAETSYGGCKRTGLGRELGVEGVSEYLRWQRVALDRRPASHLAAALDV